MGLFTYICSNVINSRQDEINTIDANIEKYEQGIANAKKACRYFEDANNGIVKLVEDLHLYFRGEAAAKFNTRLLRYGTECKNRADDMNKLIKNYKNRIKDFENDRADLQNKINSYQEILNTLQWLHL